MWVLSDCEKFKEQLPNKGKFYSFLTVRRSSDKEYEHIIKAWGAFQMKTMKNYQNF